MGSTIKDALSCTKSFLCHLTKSFDTAATILDFGQRAKGRHQLERESIEYCIRMHFSSALLFKGMESFFTGDPWTFFRIH